MLEIIALILAILPLSAAAQSQKGCSIRAETAAREAVLQIADAKQIVIPPGTFSAVVSEIATQVCAEEELKGRARVSEIASTVASSYFESAIRLGKSSEVATLVEGAIDGSLGLGLDDLRRYGVITVLCLATGASVDISGSSTRCGKRTLLNIGNLRIQVRNTNVVLCEAETTLSERQEKSCDCAVASGGVGVVKMECK